MDTHKNARLTPKGREEMMRAVVNGVQSYAAAARKFNTTPKTVAKWVKCFRAEGVDGLCNHSQDLFIGQPNFASHMRRHRGLAPTALHREAHCSRSWRLAAKSAASSNGVDSISSAPWRQPNFRAACFRLGLRQVFIRPYTPKTNGKAERFIQAALRE